MRVRTPLPGTGQANCQGTGEMYIPTEAKSADAQRPLQLTVRLSSVRYNCEISEPWFFWVTINYYLYVVAIYYYLYVIIEYLPFVRKYQLLFVLKGSAHSKNENLHFLAPAQKMYATNLCARCLLLSLRNCLLFDVERSWGGDNRFCRSQHQLWGQTSQACLDLRQSWEKTSDSPESKA